MNLGTAKAIERALSIIKMTKSNSMTNANIALALGCKHEGVSRFTAKMRASKLLRIKSWALDENTNCPIPVYSSTRGKDAKKPNPKTHAEYCRKYRLSKIDKEPELNISFNENLALRSKNHAE